MTVEGQGGSPQPGWYPDPQVPGQQRWWDGSGWTDQTAPLAGGQGGVAAQQPAGGQPAYAAGAYGGAGGAKIDTWLWQSIVATLLCCLPAGVVGIIFASKSQSAAAVGDIAGAQRAAKTARTWTLVAVSAAVLTIVGYIVFIVAVGATAFWA